MPSPSTRMSPQQASLARTVVEVESHVAQRGWDAPVGVFALVRTTAALAQDPSLASLLDAAALAEARTDPTALTVIEQEDLPASANLEELLGQLAWPETVDGVVLSVEQMTVPLEVQERAAAIADAEQRLAAMRQDPGTNDVRLVVGVLRSGESWCAVRGRRQDEDANVTQGEAVVPGLIEALRSTLD
ncbi:MULTISPECIES: PPA1309 family protein [unclassified Actinomyces]|uniref:PPA1309 family protein n=1 Tax=unclassified Actinomyces TaxID=2609248 RepID=UPI002016F817|nr:MULTISPECIES: PPA1309 family protein [unclassified Actinomyces]MCL3778062.1 hypothetical protein [Actinomyces sp. AC-20-1]MCL3790629.1 hypothetical protein [Actinomyces sp. 187325]MCL3792879.1 hypothetical protein [Actinomyces sp. 186855]MCL3795365.1 hypothetical protein [Actinomyces sp. 217892]